ncbi:MAG: hypothetical protein QF464_09695 [Myxococcota bacterium]|jgi:hypothetical protein|nr:hypothetical protein [Myxococcota bacterium]
MTRSRFVSILAALTLALAATACSSGPSDPASYRAAMKGFAPALTKLENSTRNASTAGDPMQLSAALGKTVSSANALLSVVQKVEVSEPSLAGLHNDLKAVAQSHVATLQAAADSAKSTPIPETKDMMNGSTDDLNAAIEAWNGALDAM